MGTSPVALAAKQVCEPVINGLGYEVVDVRYVFDGGRWCLRFFIDRPGGVGIDDCEKVSREIETVIEVEDVVKGAYVLEVSSPGLDRPLFKPSDYERFTGSLIKIKTTQALDGQKVFVGRIKGADGDGFMLAMEPGGKEMRIYYNQVQKANLEVEF
jgi:ribosome maturation factor RimP